MRFCMANIKFWIWAHIARSSFRVKKASTPKSSDWVLCEPTLKYNSTRYTGIQVETLLGRCVQMPVGSGTKRLVIRARNYGHVKRRDDAGLPVVLIHGIGVGHARKSGRLSCLAVGEYCWVNIGMGFCFNINIRGFLNGMGCDF